jgi:hypothetical protein
MVSVAMLPLLNDLDVMLQVIQESMSSRKRKTVGTLLPLQKVPRGLINTDNVIKPESITTTVGIHSLPREVLDLVQTKKSTVFYIHYFNLKSRFQEALHREVFTFEGYLLSGEGAYMTLRLLQR